MEPKTVKKKIVSKGRFVRLVGFRAGLGLSAFACLLLAVPCVVMTLGLLFTVNDDVFRDHRETPVILWDLAQMCFWGAGTCLIWAIGFSGVNRAQAMEVGVPLTRANTADLPATESLVRPSSEPIQAQETVLLRAAAEDMKSNLSGLWEGRSNHYGATHS